VAVHGMSLEEFPPDNDAKDGKFKENDDG